MLHLRWVESETPGVPRIPVLHRKKHASNTCIRCPGNPPPPPLTQPKTKELGGGGQQVSRACGISFPGMNGISLQLLAVQTGTTAPTLGTPHGSSTWFCCPGTMAWGRSVFLGN